MGEWHGVTTDADGRVTELDLRVNRLTGEIPAELGNLTNLREMDLGSNRLTGEIEGFTPTALRAKAVTQPRTFRGTTGAQRGSGRTV